MKQARNERFGHGGVLQRRGQRRGHLERMAQEGPTTFLTAPPDDSGVLWEVSHYAIDVASTSPLLPDTGSSAFVPAIDDA